MIKNWKPLPQLLLSFAINLAIYFGINLFINYAWPDDDQRSVQSVLFKSLFLASWLTIIFNWRMIRNIFSRKRHEQ